MDSLQQIQKKLNDVFELPGLNTVGRFLAAAGSAYAAHVVVIPTFLSLTAAFIEGVVYIRVQYYMHHALKEGNHNTYHGLLIVSITLRGFFVFSTLISIINVGYNVFLNKNLYSKFGFLKRSSLQTNKTLLSEESLAVFRSKYWLHHILKVKSIWCVLNIGIGLSALLIGLYNGKIMQNMLLPALDMAASLVGIRYAYVYQEKFIVTHEREVSMWRFLDNLKFFKFKKGNHDNPDY